MFAIIDTASKTGTQRDATAVTFFACDRNRSVAQLSIGTWASAHYFASAVGEYRRGLHPAKKSATPVSILYITGDFDSATGLHLTST
jgi:hypothetical protein